MKAFCIGFLIALPLLAACGSASSATSPEMLVAKEPAEEMEAETEEQPVIEGTEMTELFLVTGMDTADSTLTLRSVATGQEETVPYNGTTYFSDKYGTMISLASIDPGDAVTVSYSDDGVLLRVQLSGETFTMQGVSDYTLDLNRRVFSTGGTNYRIASGTPVYENGRDEGLFSIHEGDILDVTGLDKDVLSFTVVTGTGTIELQNIGVFEGGWLNLDSKKYFEINGDMKISAEEGTHVLTVANDGWGDSTVVAVKRGETVAVDLEALKGEGPKYCELSVAPNVPDAVIRLDGQKLAGDVPTSIRYGLHSLAVSAEGYDTWQSRLFVNSSEAVIEVELQKEGTSAQQTGADEAAEGALAEKGSAGSLAGSLANSRASTEGTVTSGSESLSQREAEQAAAETMLDTMSGMLDTLTGTSLGSD